MSRLIAISIFVCSLIAASSSNAEEGFRIGPDGNAYKLIDCSIEASSVRLKVEQGQLVSEIRWFGLGATGLQGI